LYSSRPVLLRRAALPLLLLLVSHAAHAEEHAVKVRGNKVYVDGELRWRGRAVTSPAVLSESGEALAFTGRDRRGRSRLVVVLVSNELEPTAFSWPVPRAAQPATAVTWLGEGRVGAGPSELHPRMVAEFSLE
jgi:hypothetical protein